MAESIVRAQVANMTIQDVITQRKLLRESLTSEMMEVVKGWGMWLETVEVTDVRILSQSLFDNMQMQFREETRRTAERLQMVVQQEIDQQKLKNQDALQQQRATMKQVLERENVELALTLAKSKAAAARDERIHALEQDLLEEKKKAEIEEQKHQLDLARAARQNEQLLLQAKHQATLQAEQSKAALDLQLKESETAVAMRRMELELERTMDPINMENQRGRVLKEIYAHLPLKDIKVVNVGAAGHGNSTTGALETLLPGVAAALWG